MPQIDESKLTRPADAHTTREEAERRRCPACVARRLHTAEDWENHPLRGHGLTPETGYSDTRLALERVNWEQYRSDLQIIIGAAPQSKDAEAKRA